MFELAALIVLGLLAAVLATVAGTAGGYLMVPLLLFLYPAEPAATVVAMSMLVVFAVAAFGSLPYAAQGRIDFVSAALFAPATVPGAVAGAILLALLARNVFDAVFVTLLTAVAIWLVLPRAPLTIRAPLTGQGVVRRVVRDRAGQTFLFSYRLFDALTTATFVGFISSLLGMGGGVLYVRMMTVRLHLPADVAAATSLIVAAAIAAASISVHVVTGALTAGDELSRAVALASGAAAGAPLGAHLTRYVRPSSLQRPLAAVLLVMAFLVGRAALD